MTSNRETIRELRAKTGLSQQKFADLFNMSSLNIFNWESGKSSPPDYVVYMMDRIVELDPNIPKK